MLMSRKSTLKVGFLRGEVTRLIMKPTGQGEMKIDPWLRDLGFPRCG